MGYNAAVVVLLDQLSTIENDPSFGRKLAAAIRWRASAGPRADDRDAPYVPGQAQCISVEHADYLQIVAVGGNTGRLIGHSFRTAEDDDIIQSLNRDRLDRKRKSKAAPSS